MSTCLVIQPFDEGKAYGKRYADAFAPAIVDARLEPYRVDRDPSVMIPITDIQRGIDDSVACPCQAPIQGSPFNPHNLARNRWTA